MTTALALVLLLLLLALLATVRLVTDGGHGCPPRSHAQDPRFGPPAARLH